MKNICLIIFIIINFSVISQEIQGVTHSGKSTGQVPFPVENYTELKNPEPSPKKLWDTRTTTFVSWGNTYVRYKKELPATIEKTKKTLNLSAWKGERVNAQLILSAHKTPVELSLDVSDLIHVNVKNHKIDKNIITTGFVRYVMTDGLNKNGKGACGNRNHVEFDSTLVADPIDHLPKSLLVSENTTRPVWLEIWVPRNAIRGEYFGTVSIKNGNDVIKKLDVKISVSERELPKPENWEFHLDLWQNPYAAARYYGTELWSKEHFQAMYSDLKHYADAGGKSITASIMNLPWNGQTQDPFQSMITWRKNISGNWEFGFDVFDKWVEFMMNLGVKKQINCYSMVPWRLSFQYFDEATNSMKTIETKPGEKVFNQMWGAMLEAFANHLKEKGWFEKTYISMDERPMEVMLETIKVIKAADKDFKISFAGGKHQELFEMVDDYCIAYGEHFPKEVKEERRKNNQISTFYTSCAHPRPNSFTFSPPSETEWYGWYAATQELDGYLRWAYASWVLEPLLDSRFTTWAAGDTFLVYPGGRTSIRFQKLIQGIQFYEKIKILKKEFKEENNQKALTRLNDALKGFKQTALNDIEPEIIIKNAQTVINSF